MSELVDAQTLQQILHISQRTRNHMEKKGLPVTGSGQAKRYNIEDVQTWIQAQRKGIESLIIGNTYNNDEITTAFQCSSQGGMRRSHITNTLVLLSNHTTDIYEDRAIVNEAGEEMLLYTGMGNHR